MGGAQRPIKPTISNRFQKFAKVQTKIIRDSFAKRSFFPLHPHIILDKLEAERDPTPELQIFDDENNTTLPPPSSSFNSPQSIRTLQRSVDKAENFISNSSELNESFKRRLDRAFRGSLKTAELTAQLDADYHNHLLPASQKKRTSRKTIPQIIGEIQIKDVKRHIAVDREREAKQAENLARKRQRPLGAGPPPTSPPRVDLRIENR